MENNQMIFTRNITKKYGKERVVQDLSISVRKNTIYGLLGPNGAGKSTTLKMLTGLVRPTSGDIFFNDEPFNRNNLTDIGFLIEQAAIYKNLSATENLKVHTTVLGLPNSRISEVLEIVDLKNTEKKRAGNFSMGMKQRLGIAIALLNEPKLLILDEPTNGLDPIGIEELRAFICSLPDAGITVILSSHILSEVEQIVDDIGIMSHGILGYEAAIDHHENLEQLFTQVVMQNREKAGGIR